jgi:hypothetical protein
MATATLQRPAATVMLPPPAPIAPSRPSMPALRARPIPVAAYPAGMPRWVTYDGRRRRVVAVHNQPALDPRLDPAPSGARRLQVELTDGRVLTLLHDGGAWYDGKDR